MVGQGMSLMRLSINFETWLQVAPGDEESNQSGKSNLRPGGLQQIRERKDGERRREFEQAVEFQLKGIDLVSIVSKRWLMFEKDDVQDF